MNRILVLGSSGSGKTTFTRQLAELLHIEAIHLDSYYWRPNWIATPDDEWDDLLPELLQRKSWVMDGNYPASLELRLQYADTVVFLDYNRYHCLWRCIGRRWQYRNRSRPDLAPGCNEKIDWEFLLWIWNYPQNVHPKILGLLQQHSNEKQIITLSGGRAVNNFLSQVRGDTAKF